MGKCRMPTTDFNKNLEEVKQALIDCLGSSILDESKGSRLIKTQTEKLSEARSQTIDSKYLHNISKY